LRKQILLSSWLIAAVIFFGSSTSSAQWIPLGLKLEVFTDATVARTVNGMTTDCDTTAPAWSSGPKVVMLLPEIGFANDMGTRGFLCNDVAIWINEVYTAVALDDAPNDVHPSAVRINTHVDVHFNDGWGPFEEGETVIRVGEFEETVNVNGGAGTEYTMPYEVNDIPGVAFNGPIYSQFITSYFDAS